MSMMMKLAACLTCAMLLAATEVQGSTIRAFSGTACNGSGGDTVQCDGSCHSFATRHSFRVSNGGSRCVTTYVNSGCSSGSGRFTFPNQNGNCQHVNTGTSIQSFKCSPSNDCLA